MALRAGQQLPDAIRGAPRLLPGMSPYFQAFIELTTCRQVSGMGPPGRIPWTAVDQYALRHGYVGDGFDDLCGVVMKVDEGYVEHLAAKAKAPAE